MIGIAPLPLPKQPIKKEVDNLSLYVDVVKKTELSQDDVIIVRIKSSAMGINATLVESVMEEHFPGMKVLIIDDTIDIEIIKKPK
jgi:hypothetical protein